MYAHVPNVYGADGKKLSKRHGAVSVDEFRADGYSRRADELPRAARLELRRQDRDHVAAHELSSASRSTASSASPATFDYEKLDWMNGVYLRALPPDEYADALLELAARAGHRLARGDCSRDGAARAGEDRALSTSTRDCARFLFEPVEPERRPTRRSAAPRRPARSAASSRGRPAGSRQALRALAERLGLKPRAGVPADPARRHGLEGLAGPLREPRAARPRRVARAARYARPRRSRAPRRGERVERPLELAPGAKPELQVGRGSPRRRPALPMLPGAPHRACALPIFKW